MDRSFSLQKLPFIALKQIIKYLTPFEIYNLCHISRRIRNQIHSVISKNQYKLILSYSFDIEVVVVCEGYNPSIPTSSEFRSKYGSYLARKTLKGFHFYIPTTEFGLNITRTAVELLCFVLKCEIDILHIEPKYCNQLIPSITDWLSSFQPSINRCNVIGETSFSPEILYLIHNLKINKKFSIQTMGKLPNSTQFNPKFDLDTLHFYQWHEWMTIENIISSNCIVLKLGSVCYFGKEMNKFLKSWIQGSNSRMRYLEINMGSILHLIDGIQVQERDKSLKRTFEHPDLDQSAFEFEGGTDIVNVNGKRATFQMEPLHEEYGETTLIYSGLLQFVVWDD